jgi:hypothetical protein
VQIGSQRVALAASISKSVGSAAVTSIGASGVPEPQARR